MNNVQILVSTKLHKFTEKGVDFEILQLAEIKNPTKKLLKIIFKATTKGRNLKVNNPIIVQNPPIHVNNNGIIIKDPVRVLKDIIKTVIWPPT